MDKNILFIDGQVFQSVAWDRGMGKYSIALLSYMEKSSQYNYEKTYILFSKNIPLDPKIQGVIKKAVPKAEHIFADLKVPNNPSLDNIPEMQKQNQVYLDKLISEYTTDENKTFLILALFVDQVCSAFPVNGRKILLFYDLIPLQYSERYGLLTSYNNYLAKYKTVLEADLILTISQTVADDVALNLGIEQNKIININGAPIEGTLTQPKKPDIKLPKRFVLMPSGDEIRKNNIRATQGFEAYVQSENDKDIALVLTSSFQDSTIRDLKAYSDNLVFTGNVPEEELRWLYKNAESLLFVSEYEGLGLPILEAAEFGLPIVCSNLAVFNEISPTAFYYSDPSDPISIADALRQALFKMDFGHKALEYPEILADYTWPNTAESALSALNSPAADIQPTKKLKLAILSPSPSGYSAIGKLVMQLHPSMHQYFDIDYYLEEGLSHQNFKRPNYLPYVTKVFPASDFDRKSYMKYDAVLYQIGNSEFHLNTIRSSLYLPGYSIFHDTNLTNVFEEVLPQHGFISDDRLLGEQLLDKKIANPKVKYVSSIVNKQQGLITHSLYNAESLEKTRLKQSVPIKRLNLPTATPKLAVSKQSKEIILLGLAGIIHPAKGLNIIEEIAKSDAFYDCKIHIFGLPLVEEAILDTLRAYPNVQIDTDLTDFQFQNMLGQLDILINFRTEYRGETSLATIEAMRFGVVPIVKKIGWYDELPDNAAVKVRTPDDLLKELRLLINDPHRLNAMKQDAKEYIEKNHTYKAYAKGLYDFISQQADSSSNNTQDFIANAVRKGASTSEIKRLLSTS